MPLNDMSRLFGLRVQLSDRVSVTITAWDAPYEYSRTGHHKIDAELRLHDHGKTTVVFPRGATWCAVNSSTSTDGNDAKELVMSLFAMKPGDTDEEYFSSYTPDQLAFAETWGELLSCEAEYRYRKDGDR